MQNSSLPAGDLRVFGYVCNEECKIKNIRYNESDTEFSDVITDDETKKQFLLGVKLSLIRKYVGAEKMDREGNEQSDTLVNQKIARFIIEYYSDLTLQEIEYAFDLNMMGRLALGENSEHYGKFSQQYVARVLSAYMIYRGKIASRAKDMLAEYESDEQKKKRIDAIHYESLAYMLKRFDAFVNSKFSYKLLDLRIWYMDWKYIESNGLSTIPEDKRKECRVKAKEHLVEEYEVKIRKSSMREVKSIREHIQKVINEIYNESDHLSLEKFESSLLAMEQVKKWVAENVDYYELVNKTEGL